MMRLFRWLDWLGKKVFELGLTVLFLICLLPLLTAALWQVIVDRLKFGVWLYKPYWDNIKFFIEMTMDEDN